MAEGDASQNVDGSEIVYDYNCSVCIRKKDEYSEAAFYCPECNEYFCKQCFFHFGCDHGALGRAKLNKWGKSSRHIQFDDCPQHKANTIQLYCPRDDVVGCVVCSQTRHKSCGDLEYIPLIVDGTKNKEILDVLQDDLNEIRGAIEQLYRRRTKCMTALEKTHTRLKEHIKEIKQQVIAVLDTLEQDSLKEVDKFREDLDEKLTKDIKELDGLKLQLSHLQDNVSKSNVDDSVMFARIKQGKELIQDKRNRLSEMNNTEISDNAKFMIDQKAEELINDLQELGTLVTSATDESQTGRHRRDQPYTVEQKTCINVKVEEDEETCRIFGMCQLSDGSIIITDYGNKRLKQLDSAYRVTNHCALPDHPCDVCMTRDCEVAVAMGETIQFVSLEFVLTPTSSFPTTIYSCWSIAYHNEFLYGISAEGTKIYEHDLSGFLQRTISTDQYDRLLFSATAHITWNPVSELLHVADAEKGLITIDLDENLVATFRPPALERGAFVVCVDEAGNTFMKWVNSDDILQIGYGGKRRLVKSLWPTECLLAYKMVFDNFTTRLLVSGADSDNMHVFHLIQ